MRAKTKIPVVRIFESSGQALVEFALVVPLFIFLLLGIFEIGRAVFTKHVLDNAVREGVRAGVIETDVNAGIAVARNACQGVLALHNLNDNCQVTVTQVSGVDAIRIDIARPHQFIGLINLGNVILRASSTMRKEG